MQRESVHTIAARMKARRILADRRRRAAPRPVEGEEGQTLSEALWLAIAELDPIHAQHPCERCWNLILDLARHLQRASGQGDGFTPAEARELQRRERD